MKIISTHLHTAGPAGPGGPSISMPYNKTRYRFISSEIKPVTSHLRSFNEVYNWISKSKFSISTI